MASSGSDDDDYDEFEQDGPTRADSGPSRVAEFLRETVTPVSEPRCSYCGGRVHIGALVAPLPVICTRTNRDPNRGELYCAKAGDRQIHSFLDRRQS